MDLLPESTHLLYTQPLSQCLHGAALSGRGLSFVSKQLGGAVCRTCPVLQGDPCRAGCSNWQEAYVTVVRRSMTFVKRVSEGQRASAKLRLSDPRRNGGLL